MLPVPLKAKEINYMRKLSFVIVAVSAICVLLAACNHNNGRIDSMAEDTRIEIAGDVFSGMNDDTTIEDITEDTTVEDTTIYETDSSEIRNNRENNSLQPTLERGPSPVFSVDDFQGYLDYLDWLSDARYYYTVRFDLENTSSIAEVPLANLKCMYKALNESFEFVLENTQNIAHDGYYSGDEKFVDAGPDGRYLDRMLNQLVVDREGKEFYTTPLKASMLGKTIYHRFDESIIRGRNFADIDYEHNSPDDDVSVVLGYNYQEIYDIGDVIRLSLYFEDYNFRVIGFYGEGTGISSGLGALDQVIFDNRIVVPFFSINYDPVDGEAYENQVIHYIQMTQGNIRINESLHEIDNDLHARYLAIITQMADAQGLSEAYYMPLWPVAITIQERK